MKRLLFIGIYFCVSGLSLQAQYFKLPEVEAVWQRLPDSVQQTGREGKDSVYMLTLQKKKYKVYSRAGNGRDFPEHVGLLLFPKGDSVCTNPDIRYFLERVLLDLLLPDPNITVRQKLEHRKSDLFWNRKSYCRGPFWEYTDGLEVALRAEEWEVTRDSLLYAVTWKRKKEELTLCFPANQQIILGRDKKELDDRLALRLTVKGDTKEQPEDVRIDTAMLVREGELWVRKGRRFWIDSLNADRYYRSDTLGFTPVYDEKFPWETWANLFLCPGLHGKDIKLKILHKKYGNVTQEYEMPLEKFRAYVQSEGFQVYFGPEDEQKGGMTATVVLYHPGLNFIHLLYVTMKKKELTDPKGSIAGILYSNIPYDNIKDLFGRYVDKPIQVNVKYK